MAYPSYYSPYQMYNPYQMPVSQPQVNQHLQQSQQPVQQQQIQSGGFVVVQSEDEVLRYPVALGTSVDFKIENQPIVIEKTMGFSQLESPRYERFRLVKEKAPENAQEAQEEAETAKADNTVIEELKAKIDGLETELEGVKTEIEAVKKKIAPKTKKKEETEDE